MQFIAALIAALSVFKIPLFFTISGLLGYEYAGVEKTFTYVYFIVFVFILSLLGYSLTLFKSHSISRTELILYTFIFWMLLNHVLWLLFEPANTQLFPQNLIFFVSLVMPGLFSARIIRVFNAWTHFIKLIELISIFVAISIVVAINLPFLEGILLSGIGGATYQSASYFSALTFGILGFYTFRAGSLFRYRLTNNLIGNCFNVFLMINMILAAILNGGRGAFLLLVVYSLLILYWIATKRGGTSQSAFRIITALATMPCAIYISYRVILSNPFLASGFSRAVSFIEVGGSSGLINWETGSSGRDLVYSTALQGISESPILGYGAFAHWDKVIPPHNIFFDLTLQFGIPLAIVILVASSLWILKGRKLWDTRKAFLLTLLLYPAVALMFSGGYLQNVTAWFGLASYFDLNHRHHRARF